MDREKVLRRYLNQHAATMSAMDAFEVQLQNAENAREALMAAIEKVGAPLPEGLKDMTPPELADAFAEDAV